MSQGRGSDFVCDLIFVDPLDHRGAIDLDNQNMPAEPVEQFLAKCADEFSMAKNGVPAADPAWSKEIGTPPRVEISQEFLKRSDARMEIVTKKIRAFFGNHYEEAQEAIEIAKGMRDAVRQEFIGA